MELDAIKFVIGAEEIIFSNLEAKNIIVNYDSGDSVDWDQENYCFLTRVKKPSRIISVIIRQKDYNTYDKALSVYNYLDDYQNPGVIIFYHRLMVDSSFYYVQMKRETFKNEYSQGLRLGKEFNLQFIETEEP